MGRSKGLLEFEGSTFVERAVSALSLGGCDPVVVVTSAREMELADLARRSGARVLVNPDPGDGPITSLRLALDSLATDVVGVVYLPLDHALVEPHHVSTVVAAARDSGAPLALPIRREKRGHPAFFGRALFPELMDRNLEGGARIVVHRHLDEACLVETDDPAVTTDIDTPEAYRKALRQQDAPSSGVGPS
jgi:CTP:molybdopterin cytidylyltransferase MocA